MMLTESELPEETIANARIFHFGTLSMTHEGVRAATVKAVGLAKEGGALISFDPNLRPPLWENLEEAKRQIAWGLSQCDILKIADNELEFMTGETDFGKGAAILHKTYPNIKVLNVTAGADGSYSFYGEEEPVFVPSFQLGGTIETTGAGRHLLRQRAEFYSGKGNHRPERGRPAQYAPFRQCGGLPDYHQKRRHSFHAGKSGSGSHSGQSIIPCFNPGCCPFAIPAAPGLQEVRNKLKQEE